jgi:tripartite-type tricarboxylate transporter receptor subunit TctC
MSGWRSPWRKLLIIAIGAVLTLFGGPYRPAIASYPEQDITIVIPSVVGGGFDSYARAITPVMMRYLPNKVNIVPQNVPTLGGGRGASIVYRAKPDGYTIGMFNSPGMLVVQQQGEVSYDLTKISWIGSMGRDVYGIAAGAKSGFKSIADLKAATRSVRFTGAGSASTAYSATLIAAELLGLKPEMISGYKGSGEYIQAVVNGEGDAVVAVLPTLVRLQREGKLRVLATLEQHSSLPGIPDATLLKQPELAKITLERLLGGPPGTEPSIIKILGDALDKALRDPELIEWARHSDVPIAIETPAQTERVLHEQIDFFERWKKYLKPG